jgi:hypothetical protein
MQMMIKKNFSAGLFCLLLSTQGHCSDYLMVIGAGGEEAKEDTIFDGAIKNIGDYVKRSEGTKVDVALNGGHVKTVALINESFPTANTKSDFLESDYKRLIQSYKLKLENNEIVAGDQLMIYVDSHGAEKEKNFKSHRIATSAGTATNLNTLAGASVVDLDQLEVLKKLAKDKGVKMAIIDGSCHSGNTLALADDNTCVISGTGPNHYGYGTFSQNFSAAMKKGKNLEEIFLEARAMDDTPGLPMISTPAGQSVNTLIYDKITPYLYHFDNKDDKLTPYLRENSGANQQCMADGNFNSLIKTINSIEELNTVSTKSLWWTNKTKELDLSNLKDLLGKYKSSLDLVQSKMKELGSDRLKKEETFNVSASVGNFTTSWKQNYSWKELLSSDFNNLINKNQERMNGETNNSKLTSFAAMKSLYQQAQAKKDELLRSQPDLAEVSSKEEDIKKLIDSTYFTNRTIAIEERKLYTALYKNAQKNESTPQVNPCQSFKL